MLWLYGPGKKVLLAPDALYPWAKPLGVANDTASSLARLIPSSDRRHFAILTPVAVSIWSTKPVRPLTLTIRATQSLTQHGLNCGLTWSPDTKWLAIQTTQNYLILYSLDTSTDAVLNYVALSEDLVSSGIAAGPNEGASSSELSLRFKATIRVDLGIVALDSNDTVCVVGCAGGRVIQTLPWSQLRDAQSTTLDHESSQDHGLRLLSLHRTDAQSSGHLMVFEDGMTGETDFTASGPIKRLEETKGLRQARLKSTKRAGLRVYNHLQKIIAYVCDRTHIFFQSLDVHDSEASLSPTEVWTAQEEILVLSWSETGLYLVSATRRGWTIINLAGNVVSSGSVERDAFICDITMGNADTELCMIVFDESLDQLAYMAQAIIRCSSLQCPNGDVATPALLISENSILYQQTSVAAVERGFLDSDATPWHQLPLPADYKAFQWPIRLAVSDKLSTKIAIAGNQGIAIWLREHQVWETFDNEDDSFVTHAIWSGDTLLYIVRRQQGYKLKALHQSSQTSNFEVLGNIDLETTAKQLSLTAKRVYFRESEDGYGKMRDIRLNLPGLPLLLGPPVRLEKMPQSHLLCCCELENGTSLHLSSTRTLVLCKALQPPASVPGVNHVMISEVLPGCIGPSIWVSRNCEVECWCVVAHSPSQAVRRIFTLGLDFPPINVDCRIGALTGLSSEPGNHRGSGRAYRLHHKMQLYLPDLSYWLLICYGVDRTYLYLEPFFELPHLHHSLEILLHRVLEGDLISGSATHLDDATDRRQEHLNMVIELIDRFPRCLEIVVACARKTEANIWRRLFEAAGSPLDLYKRCVAAADFRTAGMYLLVLHTLESAEETKAETCRLFQSAIQAKDFELGKELLRFLTNIGYSDAAESLVGTL